MASASFKSSTRGSALSSNDAGSSSKSGERRRSRSLSRYSGRVPPPRKEDDEFPAPPRGKFVNTARGSSFEEISLDDLADEFFTALELDEKGDMGMVRARAGRRLSDASFLTETESSRRRGRSVSRKPDLDSIAGRRRLSDASFLMETESSKRRGRSVSRKPNLESNAGGRRGFDGNARRRSLSVARYHCIESESESDFSGSSSSLNKLSNPQKRNGQSLPLLRRSESQQDLKYLQESHSINSSSLTDYEPLDVHIGAVVDHRKTEHPVGEGENASLYEVMRKEVRHAVDEIKTELEKVIENTKPSIQSGNDAQLKSSEVVQAIAEIRRNYTTKLEESERRKQELLAELAAEEQRGQELSQIVKELLSGTKEVTPERHPRVSKRSSDKSRISMHLFEDAEKYFEDFLSSVDDTDISSFDGERSDGGSITGGCQKSNTKAQNQTACSPAETDGLILPWLEWETSNDGTPISCQIKETRGILNSALSASSQGSWSPGITHENYSLILNKELVESKPSPRVSSFFNMDDYAHLEHSEDFLAEVFLQRLRVNSGSMVLCRGTLH